MEWTIYTSITVAQTFEDAIKANKTSRGLQGGRLERHTEEMG